MILALATNLNAQNRLWGIANGYMSIKAADTQLFSTELNGEDFQMYYSTDTLMPFQNQTRIPGCELLVSKQNKKLYTTQYDLESWTDDKHFLMEYDRDSNQVTALVYFDSISYPLGNLLEHSNGNIYGFLAWEGSSSYTNVHFYKYDLTLQTTDTLHTLNSLGLLIQGQAFGFGTESEINVIEAADGNIYGLTTLGGANNYGAIFMYDPINNSLTKKLDFTSSNIPSGYFYKTNDDRILGSCVNKVYEYDYINNTINAVFQSATDNVPNYLVEGVNNQFFGYNDNHYVKKLDFNNGEIVSIIDIHPYHTDYSYPFDSPYYFIGRPSITSNNTIVGIMHYSYYGEPGGCTAKVFEIRNVFNSFYTLEIKSHLIGECQHLNSKLIEICYPQTVHQNEVILLGDSLLLGNAYQTYSGTYYDTLSTFCGEDSIIVTNLIIADILNYQTASICKGDTIYFGGIPITTQGLYYEIITIGGFDSVSALEVILYPSYNIEISPSLCAQDSFLFQGNYYGVGNYEFIHATQNGCDSIMILSVSSQVPDIQLEFDATILNSQPNTNYSIQCGYPWDGITYTWLIEPASHYIGIDFGSHALITFFDTVEYSITVIGTNDCGSDTAIMTVKPSTNIGIFTNEKTQFNIHPNPASTYIHIDGLSNKTVESITVMDISGRLVEKMNYLDKIDVSGYKSGTYFIKLELDDRSTIVKFVKL
jgi:hypothetical protein